MAVKQIDWYMKPGATLPSPVLQDDSASFSDEIVKQVRDWLIAETPELKSKPPTPQILYMDRLNMPGTGTPIRFKISNTPERIQRIEFERGTSEVLLRDVKTKIVLAAYHYAVARNIYDGRMILGPELRVEQRASLSGITLP